MPIHDKNNRPILCDGCHQEELEAFANDETLAEYGVKHIDDMDDDEIREAASPLNADCCISGHCLTCNGPDDGDCGDGEDIHD
jgi:hypothetical protein